MCGYIYGYANVGGLCVHIHIHTYIHMHLLTVITMNDLGGRSSSFAVLD